MASTKNSSRRKRKYTPGRSTKPPGTKRNRAHARQIRAMRWLGVEWPV